MVIVTASARGDLSNVKLLAAETGTHSTDVMSQALTLACNNGRNDVVDWLMTYTTADLRILVDVVTTLSVKLTSLAATCCYCM